MNSQLKRLTPEHPALRVKEGALQLHSAGLETPERTYDADVANLTRVDTSVMCFTFAKRSVNDPTRLRTRLQIRIGEESVLRYFWNPSLRFRDGLRTFLKVTGPLPPDHPETLQADADHSDWANVCSMARADQYSVLDFHELSPTGLAKFTKFKDASGLDVRSVVRIQIAARQLLTLLDVAETFVDDIRTRVHLAPNEMELEE